MKALTFLILCFASIVLAEDFKTIDGKEYKNITISRVEPDGIVLITSSGISKVYFSELPKEVQERFHYDAAKAAAYSGEQAANQEALLRQQQESQRKRAEEREKYWSEHPAPEPQRPQPQSTKLTGSSLDRPAYGQATNADFLFRQYAENQINADRQYKGRIFTISGTIKSITSSEGQVAVELVVPHYAPEVYYMRCIFNDSRGLEQFQSGNPISLTGTVAGVSVYKTLIIKDCRL